MATASRNRILWLAGAAFLRRCKPDQVPRVSAVRISVLSNSPSRLFIAITLTEIGRKVNAFNGFRLYTPGDTCY